MQIRKLELLVSVLVFLMISCYFGETSYMKPSAAEVMKVCLSQDCRAILPPETSFPTWALDMPFLLESGFALFMALLINIAVASVSTTDLSAEDSDICSDLTLNSASFLLKNVLGKSSSIIHGISLLASYQSSSISGLVDDPLLRCSLPSSLSSSSAAAPPR